MKNLLHRDYWCEIPAGKFLVGLSVAQRSMIIERMHQLGMYAGLSAHQLQLLESIRKKHWNRTKYLTNWFRTRTLTGQGNFSLPGVPLSDEENTLYLDTQLMSAFYFEMSIHNDIPFETEVDLDRFYMARFPLTDEQRRLFRRGTPLDQIAGVLEPEHEKGDAKCAARVDMETSLRFCAAIEGRLPTNNERQKAARGLDGRLYPWGNAWDLSAGFFFYGQDGGLAMVDNYPRGVSPYGVWDMAGDEPELVRNIMGNISAAGCHPKESSAATAWLDHIIPMPHRGDFVSLRPVLDRWPMHQWPGFAKPETPA